MKNIQTPRTLADCQFTVGHRQVLETKLNERSAAAAEFVIAMIGVALLVVGLASLVAA